MTMAPTRGSENEKRREELRVQARREKNTEQRRINRVAERLRNQAILINAATSSSRSALLGSVEIQSSVNRAASTLAKTVAYTVEELTNKRGLDFQKLDLEKFMALPTLQHAWPEFVVHHQRCEHALVVCDGLKTAWERLKWGHGKDQYLARKVLEATLISVEDAKTRRVAADYVGMNKSTLRRAIKCREGLNGRINGKKWAKGDRKKRSDALDQRVIDLVKDWWIDQMRVSPCKKDVQKLHLKGCPVPNRDV
jgi:hypothetical protein